MEVASTRCTTSQYLYTHDRKSLDREQKFFDQNSEFSLATHNRGFSFNLTLNHLDVMPYSLLRYAFVVEMTKRLAPLHVPKDEE